MTRRALHRKTIRQFWFGRPRTSVCYCNKSKLWLVKPLAKHPRRISYLSKRLKQAVAKPSWRFSALEEREEPTVLEIRGQRVHNSCTDHLDRGTAKGTAKGIRTLLNRTPPALRRQLVDTRWAIDGEHVVPCRHNSLLSSPPLASCALPRRVVLSARPASTAQHGNLFQWSFKPRAGYAKPICSVQCQTPSAHHRHGSGHQASVEGAVMSPLQIGPLSVYSSPGSGSPRVVAALLESPCVRHDVSPER